MKYVLRRTFEKIFSNIRDSSNGAFDFGDVTVTDIKAQQDPSCNTGTWCTEMNLAISVRVSESDFQDDQRGASQKWTVEHQIERL